MKVFIVLLLGLAAASADKIVGGTSTGGPIPYQARIQYGNGRIHCGGSLIEENWVLSAAHCRAITDVLLRKRRIALGYYDSPYDNSVQYFSIAQQIVHANYDYKTLDSDIMLLKLSSSATLNSNVGLIPLPDYSTSTSVPSVGTECEVSGWGRTSSGRSTSATLHSVNVDVVSQSDCNTAYGDITNNMMCLSRLGKDSCEGDSGGPAVCGTGDERKLYGIISWGKGCADPDYPGIYTRVAQFTDWIEEMTGKSK